MSSRKRLVVVVLIVLAVAYVGFRLFRRPASHKLAGEEQPIPVNIAPAVHGNVPIYLDALGTVQAYRTVTVQPMISGPLLSVEFREGEEVHKGQMLAEIDPRPYRAALDQVLAKQSQDEATLADARLNLKRYKMLIAQQYASAQQVADQEATVAETAALVKQDKAAVETARTNLSYTRILAPISGRTGILQVNAGNIVTPGISTGIVVINTMQPIYVTFSLPQQDLPTVQKAIASKSPDVLAENSHNVTIDRGVLVVLDNQVNANTGTLTMRARFSNPGYALWPGAFVNVKLLARIDRNVITIPAIAVRQGPNGSFVYLVTPAPAAGSSHPAGQKAKKPPAGPHVIMRPVHVAYSNQNIAEITSGLAVGDQVVTEGGSRLRSGSLIRIEHAGQPSGGTSPSTSHGAASQRRRG
ncbi:MAG: efflux RND transporter periplasmic adaptor subunit [Pseudomonadota bacterium]|nr:efflux RND transporter periplasmic adaptor subunit [Pseudomonadota bacterium]